MLIRKYFYPRPPRGGRPQAKAMQLEKMTFLSTPSARRATLLFFAVFVLQYISIHALREEGDQRRPRLAQAQANFYPRPPRGGRRLPSQIWRPKSAISIHALREEGDSPRPRRTDLHLHFYPRPPRGGRHSRGRGSLDGIHISIHALREEGDTIRQGLAGHAKAFLSTPSARRATARAVSGLGKFVISIHALREEGDFCLFDRAPDLLNFYPRPPRGGRPRSLSYYRTDRRFLSTPSARRATGSKTLDFAVVYISIHALREEGDHLLLCVNARYYNFYPRPPRGGRPDQRIHNSTDTDYFYPRPPRGGRRFEKYPISMTQKISIHALREEGDGTPMTC